MTQIDILEPDFSHRDCTKYKLLMLLSKGSLSFFVLSPLGRLMALKEIPLQLHQNADTNWYAYLQQVRTTLMAEKILHLPYKETIIGISLEPPMLAPGTNHQDSDLLSAYRLTLAQKIDSSIVLTEDIDLDISYLFNINKELNTILKSFFPNSQIIHGASGLIRYYMLLSNKTKNNLVSFNISPPGLSISVMHLGRLKFHNEYKIADANDLVYYIMLVNNKLLLKPGSTTYFVTGHIELDSTYIQQLQRYIKDIQHPDIQEIITFSNQTMPWSKHYFFDLFSLYLCA